jgi:transcription termination/antitermination protein NusG
MPWTICPQLGPCVASLSASGWYLLRQVEACYSIPLGERKYALKELVRLTDGPLAHFVGEIERLDSNGRLKDFMSAVMRGISVHVTETQVEPVVVFKRAKTERRRAKALAPT